MSTTILQQLLERCPADSPVRSYLSAAIGAWVGEGFDESGAPALFLDFASVEAEPAFPWGDPVLPAAINAIPELRAAHEIALMTRGELGVVVDFAEAPPARCIVIAEESPARCVVIAEESAPRYIVVTEG